MTDILKVGSPLPASMGRCADLYHDVRDLRLSMEKQVAEIKARESEIKDYLIDNLSAGQDTGAAGLRYRAQVTKKRTPKLNDWGVFCSWIRKNDRFDMLQKRINEKAVAETAEEMQRNIPGTEFMNVKALSVTKIG